MKITELDREQIAEVAEELLVAGATQQHFPSTIITTGSDRILVDSSLGESFLIEL